jgi:hypothetical protein
VETLDGLYLRGEAALRQLRAEAPVGRFLHAVKVPSRLTESIVALACAQLFGDGCVVLDERGVHDLRVRTPSGRRLNVAVKGTGRGDWVSITASDRAADILVWVDYSQRLADNTRPAILRKLPGRQLRTVGDRAFLRRLASTATEFHVQPDATRAA